MEKTGDILRKERERQKLSIKDIEKETRIRASLLEAIEKNDWTPFTSQTYILGVICSYGEFLKLNTYKLKAFFRRENELKESTTFKSRIPREQFTPLTKTVFRVMLLLVTASFVFYFGLQLKAYFALPHVEILAPKETIFPNRIDKIELVGKTEKDSIIFINGEQVYPDDTSTFRTNIPLPKDKNTVVITVTGANGKETILEKEYIRKP